MMTTDAGKGFWLQQQETLKLIQELKMLQLEKLTIASQAAANPQTSDVALRLLLREASVIGEIIMVINGE
jgi:hypothetical protein